jgi:hypothetical protein
MRVYLDRDLGDIDDRLAGLTKYVPLVGARLRGEDWWNDAPPQAVHVTGNPLENTEALRAFDLGHEPPMRALVGDGELALVCEHAAFDGLAMVALLRFLLGGEAPQEAVSAPAGPPDGMRPYLERIAHPAHVVARSIQPPATETMVSSTTTISGRRVTGRIAAACAAACGLHNRRLAEPLTRIGITVPIAGPVAGVGNVAGYRRIDVSPSTDIVSAVVSAIRSPQEPQLQVRSTRYLKLTAPLVPRLSDTFLISNLGRHAIPGARRVDFYPVARGSSAVAFGLASVDNGETTLALRSRHLNSYDAQRIVDDAVSRFEASS